MAIGFGPMNTMPAAASALGKASRFGAALLAGGDNLIDDQVTFSCRRGADRYCGIRHRDVQRIPIRIRIDGDRFDPQFACGFNDPAGYFAAICNQDTLKHAVSVAPSAGLFGLRRYRTKVNCVSAGRIKAADNRRMLQYCLIASVSTAPS